MELCIQNQLLGACIPKRWLNYFFSSLLFLIGKKKYDAIMAEKHVLCEWESTLESWRTIKNWLKFLKLYEASMILNHKYLYLIKKWPCNYKTQMAVWIVNNYPIFSNGGWEEIGNYKICVFKKEKFCPKTKK